jgi:hypothetical protein
MLFFNSWSSKLSFLFLRLLLCHDQDTCNVIFGLLGNFPNSFRSSIIGELLTCIAEATPSKASKNIQVLNFLVNIYPSTLGNTLTDFKALLDFVDILDHQMIYDFMCIAVKIASKMVIA